MRSVIRNIIIGDTGLTAIIPASRWFDSSSVDEELPDRPFAVLRYGEVLPGSGKHLTQRLDVWVHDDRGSYARIEAVQRRLRSVLNSAVQGGGLTVAEWQGDGPDLNDQAYGTNVKTSTFRIVGTGI